MISNKIVAVLFLSILMLMVTMSESSLKRFQDYEALADSTTNSS